MVLFSRTVLVTVYVLLNILSLGYAQPTFIKVQSGGLPPRRGGIAVNNATHISFSGGLSDTPLSRTDTLSYDSLTGLFTTTPNTFTLRRDAAIVTRDQQGQSLGISTSDYTTWAIGGVDSNGVVSNAVVRYNGDSWSTLTTTTSPAPAARRGAVAALLPNCANSSAVNPVPCIVLFGGDNGGTTIFNDVWFLWITETPARWERNTFAQTNAPPGTTDAAIGVSPDGTSLFIFGGRTASGVNNEIYTFAPLGFSDFTNSEATNVALNNPAFESSTDPTWGFGGPGRAVDGNLQQAHDNGPPARACTHTLTEADPWWKVDLRSSHLIDRITIYPRNDGSMNRYFDYDIWFGNSNVTWNANPPIPRPYPSIGGGIVNINLNPPMAGRFFHFHLPRANRILTLCEVQLWQKRPYIWRRLSGVRNVALNKPSRQSSFESNQPGEAFRGNDGLTTNRFGSSPFTCTHTANTGIARIPFWMVDLGDTFDINQIELWPRTDCCPERNRFLNIYVGFSVDANFNTIVPGVPLDLGTAAGSRRFTAPLRGRYVIVTRTPQRTNNENFLTICELMVWANRLLDQPTARSGMSYTSFRGNLVIYGGTGATGFTIDNNVRMFDMVSGKWAAAVTPLGDTPMARSLTHFLPIPDSSLQPIISPSRDLLIYSGVSNAETLTDANILRFPSCPAFVRDGILSENCTHSGTVCRYTCLSGFTPRNRGPIICRQDGLWDGIVPPCQALTPTAPRGPGFVSELGVSVDPAGTLVNVSYTAPASLGYYSANGVSTYNVFAAGANDFYEDFSSNDFVDPNAWRRFAEFPIISNNHYFADGKLWLDAAAGSDYWLPSINANGFNVMNRPSAPLGPWSVRGDPLYRGLILHRDWPSNVDPAQPWVFDALLEAGTLPNSAQLCIGIFDINTCPFPTTSLNFPSRCAGHIGFYAGLRRVSENFFPGFEAVGSGIFGGWLGEPALSTNIYMRIEYSPTGSVNPVGVTYTNSQGQSVTNANQVFKIYFKYRAQDEWVRMPYQIENGAIFNGTNLIPPVFRPAIIAKLWNGNVYARAVSSVRYIRIGPAVCANPGCSRTVSGNTLMTSVTGLTPGARYVFGARAATLAGYGPSALTSTIYTMPAGAAPVIPAVINAAMRRPAWQSSTYGNDIANNGAQRAVDNDWNTIHHTNCGNEWWAVDLGVNYAAIKQVYIWHRIDCCRERLHHFSFYAGQDQFNPRNNPGQYSRDIDASRLNGARTDWTQYSMADMLNGVRTFGQSEGRFNFIAYGRYFYLVNNPYGANCLHTREIQVFVANSCPARPSVGATVVTGGGRICSANAPFGAVCTQQCSPGFVQVSGATTATCNGETWDAPPLVCRPACPDLDAPAFASFGQHELLNFDFNRPFSTALGLAVDTLEPITLPFNQFFAIADGVLNAFARIGCNSDPSAVFYLEKIRAIDGNGKYTFSADMNTADRAGLLFRIVDARNFYRAYYEISTQSVYIEKLVNGIPVLLTSAVVTVLADVTYNMAIAVDGPNVFVSLNGRLAVQTADRQFAQGYVGLYAGSTAWFDNVLFLNTVSSCRGASDGERCLFTCGAGLITRGPNNRTCLTDTVTQTTATWTPTLPALNAPLNDPGRLLCTLDPPVFPAASLSVPENSIVSTSVGSPLMASSTSPLYPVQYVITAQFPNDPFTGGLGTFTIDFCSGQVKVAQPLALNFEVVRSWIITVRAFIFGFESAETFRNVTISVLNVDEPPVITESTVFLPENTPFASLVGSPSWWDPDNSSVVWSLDVDGSFGRFLMNTTTGQVFVNAQTSNSSGFPSLFTGAGAPLNYETAGLPYELIVVASQTAYTPSTVTSLNPPLSTLFASGKLNVQLTDTNDPPMILPGGELKLFEVAATSVPHTVGVINVIDEDAGSFNSTVSYSLISTSSYPSNCPVSAGATLPLSDGMFTVTGSGLVGPTLTLQQIPSVTVPINGATAWRDLPAVPFNGYLVRAVYTLCLQASDAFGGTTIAPVDVSVVANVVNQPVVLNISLATYSTQGNEIVTFGGSGFVPNGGVQPPRAWYSNGIYSYNATNCVVIDDSYMRCTTVPGIGKDHVWTIWWDERNPVLFANTLSVNYIPPMVTSVSNNLNLTTTGDSTIVFTGTNFGPPNTTVTIVYGKNNFEYTCNYITNPSDSYTVARCKTVPGVGQDLPWTLTVGEQTFSSSTSSYVISYGNPIVTSLSVPFASTHTITTLDTAGGQNFIVTGMNFGPEGTLNDNRYGIIVTYGSSTGNLLTAEGCVQGSGSSAHTTLTCRTVAGVSTNHKVAVAVAGVSTINPFPTTNSSGLSYLKPTITRMDGEGTKQADTGGGQIINIYGNHFGPISFPITTIDWVTYGHSGDTDRYAAAQCRVAQQPPFLPMITCVTAPGVGLNHSLYLSIGGQVSNIYDNAVSYAAPQVISFFGDGSSGANTIGNEEIFIDGKNFGPADAYTNSLLSVSYGTKLERSVRGIINNVTYNPASCVISKAHVQLKCRTAEGAGRNLAWQVIVDGVVSTQPTTAYAAPVITRVQYPNANLVTQANVDGGEVVEIKGSFFGPTTYPGSGIPLIQSITYGISGTEYTIPPSLWGSVSHTLIQVTLLPGTGTNLYFRVTVADQVSTTISSEGYFSFGIPSIVALVPSRGPTYSDSLAPYIVTAITDNLPLKDPFTRITLMFGNKNPVLLSPNLPSGDMSISKAKNADDTINITFALPTDGGGLYQGVQFHLGPVTTTVAAYRTEINNNTAFSYNDPVVTSIIVTKARFLPEGTNSSEENGAISCPFPNGWDAASSWYCGDSGLQRLELGGTDFTSAVSAGNDGVRRSLEILTANFTGLGIANLGEVWSSTNEVFVYKWEHSTVVAYIRRRQGTLRFTISSPPYWDVSSSIHQVIVSPFLDVSPDIGFIGDEPEPFPTVGGTIATMLTMSIENIASADNLEVTVGNNTAALVNPDTNTIFADATAIKNYILAKAALPGFAGKWTFGIVVPPGQGRNQVVRVFRIRGSSRDGSPTSGVSIDYQPPDFTGMAIYEGGNWGTTVTITAFTKIVVPTDASAKLRIFGTNLGPAPTVFVGEVDLIDRDKYAIVPTSSIVACPGTAGTHTCYEFDTPEGQGDGTFTIKYQPLGFKLFFRAGDQTSRGVPFSYRSPSVTMVVSNGNGFPTIGGVLVSLIGSNFGHTRSGGDPFLSVEFGRITEVNSWLSCTNPVRINHYLINCTLPEGAGGNLSVRVQVAELLAVTPSAGFSYDAPVVSNVSITYGDIKNAGVTGMASSPVSPFVYPFMTGATTGGDIITITGHNFGYRDPLHCAFLTWAYRSSEAARNGATWKCNNGEDWLGEGEISPASILSWSHQEIVFVTPSGLGVKELQLSIRGNTLPLGYGSNTARRFNYVFKYAAPQIFDLLVRLPNGDLTSDASIINTEGGDILLLNGTGFGITPQYHSSGISEVFNPPVPLNEAVNYPTAQVAIIFHRACISRGLNFLANPLPNSVTIPLPQGNVPLSSCASTIRSQRDDYFEFRSGPGIGRNRTISVVVLDGPEVLRSNPTYFDYHAPEVSYFNPNPVILRGVDVTVNTFGSYFGNYELSGPDFQNWQGTETDLRVFIGGYTCKSPNRRRDVNSKGIAETVIFCNVDAALTPAGRRNVTVFVAGQVGTLESFYSTSLVVGCAAGWYGRENETCVPCPAQSNDPNSRGAECFGYIDTINKHTYPRPNRGWYNLNSSDANTIANGVTTSMLETCPDGFQDNKRDVCIVPCDPPEACLGDNYCAYGYTSKAPLFRCAYCDRGFYKRAGECIKCPDSPAGLFIGFILLVVFMCGVAFQLNKRQINIAVVSIGIDFFQVLAIFSQSRIKWPPVIKELFHILSAFNLNIEIVAPECLIPDVSYKQKFWFIMILPLSIGAIFAVNYVAILGYKVLILGQDKKRWHSHSPALVSSLLILIYMLYLYLTRTIFDVFNCTPTMPPDGFTYLQVVFERCGVAGGTQLTLLPYAVAGLIVYTAGYPAFIGYTLWKNREIVMEDQLLRAKGVGTDLLSGPRTYNFRLTYGRSYFQFKPDLCLWILAIVIRKFFIALTAVVFNKNASFQMAACLLVMFVAYAAQTHFRPYMSPGIFDQVLRDHTEASFTSAIHARLRSALANIETRGRKKVRKNLLNFDGKVDRAAVFGILTSWLFEYNTVEEIMLFAGVIICLMGIMYQANEVNTYYPESKDSVTAVVLIVIIAAIIYFVTVLVTEIVIMYNEEHRAKRLAAESTRKRAKGVSNDNADDKQRRGQGRLVDESGDINTGKLDTQMNPLFMNKGGDGVSATSGLGIDSIMAQRNPPPPELWIVFQQGYADLHTQLEAANAKLAEAKRVAQLSSLATEDGAVAGSGPAMSKKKAFVPQSTGTANTNGSNGDAFAAFRKGNKNAVAIRSMRKNQGDGDE